MLCGVLLFSGCAQIEDLLEDDPEEEDVEETEIHEDEDEVEMLAQPDWYSDIRPYKVSEGYIKTAASSVSQDSSRAHVQAKEIAHNRLVNGAVRVLEHLRSEISENADDAQDLKEFIEIRYELDAKVLAELAERVEEEVTYKDDPGHYQAYVSYQLDKDQLTDHLTEKISNSELAWVLDQHDIAEYITAYVGTADDEHPAEADEEDVD